MSKKHPLNMPYFSDCFISQGDFAEKHSVPYLNSSRILQNIDQCQLLSMLHLRNVAFVVVGYHFFWTSSVEISARTTNNTNRNRELLWRGEHEYRKPGLLWEENSFS